MGAEMGKIMANKDFLIVLDEVMNLYYKKEMQGISLVADEILRLSALQVPLDTGALQNSGRVDLYPTHRYVEVGYHTPYASRLHEHPEYNFQNGRKGKYLEDPIKNNLERLNTIVGKTLQAGIFND